MRATSVHNWSTFKEWVGDRQHPKLGNFGEYWFKELEIVVSSPATGEIVHVDVEVNHIPLRELAGGSKDREKRLAKYGNVLHENAWRVYILIHSDNPNRPAEQKHYDMHAYYGAFLRDKSGQLVYFRALDDKMGMGLWNMPTLAKQLSSL